MNTLVVGHKKIGPPEPVFIIAEAGVNHNGDLELAKKLIAVAAEAGADAVKFQTFSAENLVTGTADQAEYQRKNIGKTESQFEMLKRLELPKAWHSELQTYATEKNILFLSTPFSEPDADFLETLNLPAYKIPSGEINNLPYLHHIAKKNRPMIISTGMSTLAEVKTAVKTVQAAGNNEIIILHSTSNYPPSLASLNLLAISTLQAEFPDCLVGYSDNGAPGVAPEIIATTLGACVIEKHFTLDKTMAGPDHLASLGPTELKEMVQAIRQTTTMLGNGVKECQPEEISIKAMARKSLISKHEISAGQVLTLNDIIIKRPGNGIPPTELERVIGKKTNTIIPADTVITWEQLV